MVNAYINLQWKGTDACYDFYCPCNPEEPQHVDGMFAQWFTCGKPNGDVKVYDRQGNDITADSGHDLDPDLTYCGRTWWLPNRAEATEVSGPGVWP